jgi:hypothetical protein
VKKMKKIQPMQHPPKSLITSAMSGFFLTLHLGETLNLGQQTGRTGLALEG